MQNGEFPDGDPPAAAGAVLIAAITPIAIKAHKDLRMVFSVTRLKPVPQPSQADRLRGSRSIHVRALAASPRDQ
jgi:hypothetical protein